MDTVSETFVRKSVRQNTSKYFNCVDEVNEFEETVECSVFVHDTIFCKTFFHKLCCVQWFIEH